MSYAEMAEAAFNKSLMHENQYQGNCVKIVAYIL